MASIVQCLIRTCFEHGERDEDEDTSPPSARTMTRASPGRLGFYTPATLEDPSDVLTDGNFGGDDHSCDDAPTGEESSASVDNVGEEGPFSHFASGGGLHGLFHRLGMGGIGPYGTLPGHGGDDNSPSVGPDSPILPSSDAACPAAFARAFRRSISNPSRKSPSVPTRNSPLRTASSFDYKSSADSIPAIQLDEIVMPGSDLQKQMSLAMSQNIEDQDDECVICLEGFTADNPRMPTLCGCGENKTYFHLPCLYQWIEQSKNCPSCRKRLRWEEF